MLLCVRLFAAGAFATCALAGGEFDLEGALRPEVRATVTLHGATSPFSASARTDGRGRFRFRRLPAAAYTVIVSLPGGGELRQTVEVGPGMADSGGRVRVELGIAEEQLEHASRHLVSAALLAVPRAALREYDRAQQCLSRSDIPGAVASLKEAVRLAPGFSAAWNNLGTIAYQTRNLSEAESHFREALRHDPASYEPLVNLGGVLLSEGKLPEALELNRAAVRRRPNDALANSQLGLCLYRNGELDSASRYLETAKRLDPNHFSAPQLALAEIHVMRDRKAEAEAELRDYLKRHPDSPVAASLRESLDRLRR